MSADHSYLFDVVQDFFKKGYDISSAQQMHRRPKPVSVSVGTRPYTPQYPMSSQQQQQQYQYHGTRVVANKDRRTEEESINVLTRTVHVRFLPTNMTQGEFATLCTDCGEVLRIRICGNNIPSQDQSWIYGFVEFRTEEGAAQLVKRSGVTLGHNGRSSLRMRATLAKQPINDRVFHDADLSKGIPCTFGQGQYGSVTLKEAVENYFSLVNKNNVAKTLQSLINNSNGSNDNTSTERRGRGSSGSDSDDVQSVTPPKTPSASSCENPSLVASGLITPFLQQQQLPGVHGLVIGSAGSINTSNSGVIAPPPPPPPLQSKVTVGNIAHAGPTGPSARPIPRVSVGTAVVTIRGAQPMIVADEFVLQRCYQMLEASMRHGRLFAQSKIQTSFFDGIAAIRALQEALEQHKPFRIHLCSMSASFSQQLPENIKFASHQHLLSTLAPEATQPLREHIARAVTEVFISMNMIALNLHVIRGTLADLIPFANCIVEVCLAAPMTNVANMCVPNLSAKSPSKESGADADSSSTPNAVTPFADDDDEEGDSINFLMKVVHDPNTFNSVEAEHDRQLLAKHQGYLCQALMSLGLAVEHANPLMARTVYNMAHLRLSQALSTSLPALKAVLHAPTVALFKNLLPTVATATPSFSEHFFLSCASGSVELLNGAQGGETIHQMGRLPPAHCGILLPVRR